MFKKFFVSTLCLVVSLTLIGSGFPEYDPGNEFEINMLTVGIKDEFQEQFQEGVFTVQDFEWENIDSISYAVNFFGRGYIMVYLKEHGVDEVLNAIEHIETLDFVKGADVRRRFKVDKFILCVKEAYHQKFLEQQFIIDDFAWHNIESIEYEPWYSYSSDRVITIYLKEHGRDEVINAIVHCRRLRFVKDAYVSSLMYIG